MRKPSLITLYVSTIVLIAIAALSWSAFHEFPAPSLWDLGAFLVVALVIENTNSSLKIHAKGSASFIVHMAAGLLFGPFWAALVAGVSTAVNQAFKLKVQPIRVVFNVAQRVLSITAAVLVYELLGGHLPPVYLSGATGISPLAVQRDIGLFFVFSLTYFLVNSASVSAAIAISSRREFLEVWSGNTKGVVGYDLGASAVAVLMAWLFMFCQNQWGFGSIGIVGVVVPIEFVRRIYGMYRHLEATSQELLEVMVKAIEARDPYTSGHSERVARISKIIAQQLGGLGAEEIEKIYKAALLHDVGKMYEEYAPLLRKESKLTPEERELLQTHAIRSADLVGIVSEFRGTVLEAVRNHHERWDGRGYPDGLAAEDIPIGARIIMVADTIDAMTTDRPYRKALGVDVVIAELQRHRGTQFDPRIVDLVIGSVTIRRQISLGGQPPEQVGSLQESPPAPKLWKA